MTTIDSLLAQAAHLPLDEQLQLLARLAEYIRQHQGDTPSVSWGALSGLAQHPLVGDDAQAWVARERAAADRGTTDDAS